MNAYQWESLIGHAIGISFLIFLALATILGAAKLLILIGSPL